MHNFNVSIGVIFLLALSPVCDAQEVQNAGADPVEAVSETPVATPAIPGEITFESAVGNVLFPHNLHVDEVKLGCIACHHQIQAMELETPHPEYLTSSWVTCQSCHKTIPGPASEYYKCSDCHHSDPDDIADETLSSKVVIHKSCWKCHKSGTGVKAIEGCSTCHVKEEK